MKQLMKFGVIVLFVAAGLAMSTKEHSSLFATDAVSAATDGSECTDPTWVGCALGWLEKGYVYDTAKGYYVKSSGSAGTTKSTTQATTTTKATTTKSGITTTTGKTSAGSHTQTTVTSTAAETTSVKANGGGLQTKATYTNKARTSPALADRSKKEAGDATLMSVIPINLIIGVLISLVVMIAEFFVVKAMYFRK